MPPAKRRLIPGPVLVLTCPECGCKQNMPARRPANPAVLECRRCLAALVPPHPALSAGATPRV